MKLSSLSLLLATIGLPLAQVVASPIKFEVISPASRSAPEVNGLANLRWGLAAAHAKTAPKNVGNGGPGLWMLNNGTMLAEQVEHHSGMRHRKCGLRMKAISISNWLREKVGLPPIAAYRPFRHGKHHHEESKAAEYIVIHHIMPTRGPFKAASHREWHSKTFSGRIHKALIILGPWEGRAVAFVLGCGIGSLLRMLYVLVVVTYRTFHHESEEGPAEIDILFAEVDEVPPPMYSDEKVPVIEKAPMAENTLI